MKLFIELGEPYPDSEKQAHICFMDSLCGRNSEILASAALSAASQRFKLRLAPADTFNVVPLPELGHLCHRQYFFFAYPAVQAAVIMGLSTQNGRVQYFLSSKEF